jgi:uncharacterized protein
MPDQKTIRLVIDTNWFVSATISSRSRQTLYRYILRHPRLTVYIAAELLAEYDRVMSRPKFRKVVSPDQIQRLKNYLIGRLSFTVVQPVPPTSADANDDYLLGMYQACSANFLLTGDPHLLDLNTFGGTTILTMRQFLTLLPLL